MGRKEDMKAGRPKRNFMEKVVTAVKMDAGQLRMGGFLPPDEKVNARRKKGI